MTNIIQPFSYSSSSTASAAETAAGSNNKGPSAKSARQPATESGVESVTLSAAAQANVALVNSAQNAHGIDQARVSAIKEALANGSYNVSPEDLASAITSVLSETRQ